MAEHPVRLTVTDDLRRSRLTVFLRLLLAIPHFIWWWLWTVAALLAAVANWFATLAAGRPPEGLYRFLTAYVRYSAHLYAYVFFAANPYPDFTGDPGYAVDVEFGERESQRRWVTGLRLFLLIPALLIATVFEGAGYALWFVDDESSAAWSGGTLLTVAFFGWSSVWRSGGCRRGSVISRPMDCAISRNSRPTASCSRIGIPMWTRPSRPHPGPTIRSG